MGLLYRSAGRNGGGPTRPIRVGSLAVTDDDKRGGRRVKGEGKEQGRHTGWFSVGVRAGARVKIKLLDGYRRIDPRCNSSARERRLNRARLYARSNNSTLVPRSAFADLPPRRSPFAAIRADSAPFFRFSSTLRTFTRFHQRVALHRDDRAIYKTERGSKYCRHYDYHGDRESRGEFRLVFSLDGATFVEGV